MSSQMTGALGVHGYLKAQQTDMGEQQGTKGFSVQAARVRSARPDHFLEPRGGS